MRRGLSAGLQRRGVAGRHELNDGGLGEWRGKERKIDMLVMIGVSRLIVSTQAWTCA